MNAKREQIENQYAQPTLFEDIILRLEKSGIYKNNISRSDIAGVDEFHLRGAEVSYELVNQIDFRN